MEVRSYFIDADVLTRLFSRRLFHALVLITVTDLCLVLHFFLRLPLLLALHLGFVFADKLAQHANIVALMLQEVKTVHASEPQLQKVVIKGFLRDTDKLG